ncbi:hypothetical protein ILYODFUR_009027 [Ilyodon furcidens]|uniref:Secreted protein n=1 Tax=Ilyodon furcidens TaxID=33524 RepID=A0ABV0SM96_9TELE
MCCAAVLPVFILPLSLCLFSPLFPLSVCVCLSVGVSSSDCPPCFFVICATVTQHAHSVMNKHKQLLIKMFLGQRKKAIIGTEQIIANWSNKNSACDIDWTNLKE